MFDRWLDEFPQKVLKPTLSYRIERWNWEMGRANDKKSGALSRKKWQARKDRRAMAMRMAMAIAMAVQRSQWPSNSVHWAQITGQNKEAQLQEEQWPVHA